MSGLEGIAALGLACNVMQLIGSVATSITVAKNILDTGTIDPGLAERNEELSKLYQDVQASLGKVQSSGDDKELKDVAGKILQTTAELKTELAAISGSSFKGKTRRVFGGTIKSLFKRQRLEKLEKQASRYQKAFETRLLVSLRSQFDLAVLQQEADFTRLETSLKAFINGLSQGHTNIESLIRNRSSAVIEHVTQESRQTRQEISAAVHDMSLAKLKAANQVLLESLRYDEMNDGRNKVETAHDGTFEWIFRNDESDETHRTSSEGSIQSAPKEGDAQDDRGETKATEENESEYTYRLWGDFLQFMRSDEERLYWISGKPGSGKSTLMKIILDDAQTKEILEQTSPTGSCVIASHFIWASGTPLQRCVRGVLASLLFQLVSRSEEALSCLCLQLSGIQQRLSLSDWSNEDLAKGLQLAASNQHSMTCLLIDGLDEIDSSETHKILTVIDRICAAPNVKCIASSRPEHVFSTYFSQRKTPTLRMQDLTRVDIQRYAWDALSAHFRNSLTLEGVVHSLCEKAEGVFLWVALAVSSQKLGALNMDDPEELARRLEQLPRGLSELYTDMWDRLNEEIEIYGEQGAKYLNLMILANRHVRSQHFY